MRMTIYAALAMAVLFLLTSVAQPAEAGVEPSPFRDVANRLDSISNGVDSVRNGMEAYLRTAPEADGKVTPSDFNRLDVMWDRLDGFMYEIWDVMDGMAWEDYRYDEEVMGALQGIRDSCDELRALILWAVYGGMEGTYHSLPFLINMALWEVQARAYWVDWTAWYFLNAQGGGGTGL